MKTAQSGENFVTYLDKLIITRFNLFCGCRDVKEDEEIFQRVYSHIFLKLFDFLETYLDKDRLGSLFDDFAKLEKRAAELKLSDEDMQKEVVDILSSYLSLIPECEFKLKNYFKGVVDSIAFESLENAKFRINKGNVRDITTTT